MNMEKMRSEQLEADLKNLQSQLNPHFLFNTLNNIYALIAIDSKKAQESVHRLSNLLRYVLYENDMLFVPIEKDIKFTENYIDLMRLRTVPNTDISILIKCENSTDKIAPLMFMTLIENAFKHGMNSTEHSFIDIKILVENGKGVMCSIENSIGEKDNMESNRTGIGLANLTKRLKLLYPNNHEFVIEKKNDRFSAFLRVDFTKK